MPDETIIDDAQTRTPFKAWPTAGRVAVYVASGLALLLVAVTVLAVVIVQRTFPKTEGAITLSGLSGEVEVLRDERGIPQIYADTSDDLFFAQGYVQAQDRFYEMDIRRHIVAGRLAELVGHAGLESDKVTRVLGWRRVAAREYGLLSSEARNNLQSFSAGVNAWLADRGSSDLSLEYVVLGLGGLDGSPQRWTPVDSLAWLKAMAWDLRGNMQDEIDRARLSVNLPASRIAELYPAYPFDKHEPILPGFSGTEAASTSAAAAAVATASGDGIGSNSWVVSGRFTEGGKPLLANDPHLSPSQPGIWYQMGLHCRSIDADCPYDVSGFTLSGVPGVVIGHNQKIAWGFTNLNPDVTDLFLEKTRGHRYFREGKWLPLLEREEEIKVRGEETRTIMVRTTGHGPLLSDVSRDISSVGANAQVPEGSPARGNGYAVALSWTALKPRPTAEALFMFNRATSWLQFRSAARRFAVPSQNLVYADTDGNIGYQAPGAVPIRRVANTGDYPSPGWFARYDWTGLEIPFQQMPRTLNPDEGYIVTANQAVTGPGYQPQLSNGFDRGYRSQRIRDLLAQRIESGRKFDTAAMRAIQMDSRNPMAQTLVLYLLQQRLPTNYVASGQRLMRNWDFQQGADSAAAAYFNVVWRNLLALTFHDELKQESLWPDGGQRWMGVMEQLLPEPNNAWWDDVTTKEVRESRDDILTQAMIDARYELTREMSLNSHKWEWGRLHQLHLDNQTLGHSGIGLVESMFNRGPVEVSGGSSAVDATAWNAAEGYAATSVPSMRMVVDLADFDASTWINLTGASGHAFNSNYADQTKLWAEGEQLAWPWSRKEVDAAAEQTLVLRPVA